MAEPKGPGSGKGAEGGYSARPKARTLDLSATDVTPESEAKPAPSATEPPTDKTKPTQAGSDTIAGASASPSAAAAASTGAGPTAAATSKPAADDKPASATTSPKPSFAETAREKTASPSPVSPATHNEGVGVLGVLFAAIAGAALAVVIIAAFGSQLIRLPEGDTARIAAAEAKLDAVRQDVAALRDQLAKAAAASDTGAIEKRLDAVGKSIDTSNGRVESIDKQVKVLAEKAAKPSVDPASIGMLAGRLDGVDLRLRAIPTADALNALDGRVAAAEAKVKDAPTAQQMAALATRIGAIDGVVSQAVKPLGDRLSALEARPAGDPDARLVVALSALEQALDAGRPFSAELAAVKSSSQNGEFASLDAYAAAGVATRAALSSELGAIIATLPPEKAAQPEGSVLDRFIASAGSVVKITPKGAPQPGAPGAGRDSIAQLTSDSDLEQALAARETLDEADQAATGDWARKAAARVAADKALAGARAAALSRLAATN